MLNTLLLVPQVDGEAPGVKRGEHSRGFPGLHSSASIGVRRVAQRTTEPMLLDLSPDDIAALEDRAETRAFEAGEVLIGEAQPIQSIFLIKAGMVEVSRMMRGRRVVLAQCGPGEIFGEIGFLDGEPATATVTALDPVSALEINRIRMSVYLRMDDKIATTFYRFLCHILAARMRDLSKKMPDLLVT